MSHSYVKMTRMRISANRLRINSGSFRERIPRIERRCQLCNQSVPVDLEDSFYTQMSMFYRFKKYIHK